MGVSPHPAPGGFSEVLKVAWPLIISSGSGAVMQFCDRIFLARYDSVSIQAALPGGVLAFTLCCLFQALAGYSGTFAAQYYGAGDRGACVRASAQGIWLSVLTWPLMALMVPLGFGIIAVSGHAAPVVQAERIYFAILMLGGIFLSINATLTGYFSGTGRTRITMVATLLGSLLNIVLDYAMIFGHWGFPRMGIAGAAIATVIGMSVPALILGVLFLREPVVRLTGLKRALAFDWPLMRRVIRFGVPSGLHQLIDVGAFAVFVMLTGRLGELALAASNIAFSINHLAFAPLFGIGVAASVVVGQYQGAGDAVAARRAGWSAMKIGWGYMAAIGISFVLLPETYYRLFGAGAASYTFEELLAVGRPLMLLLATWGLFDAVNIVLGGALKGAGDTRFVMFYMLIGGWFFWLPCAALILWCGGGILAQWLFVAFYCAVLACGFLLRWVRGNWSEIRMIERPCLEPPPAPPGGV